MKQIHCSNPHPSRKTRDFSFAKYFNLSASPRMAWDKSGKAIYIPIHRKHEGRTIWDSWRLGTRMKGFDKQGNPFYYQDPKQQSKEAKSKKKK